MERPYNSRANWPTAPQRGVPGAAPARRGLFARNSSPTTSDNAPHPDALAVFSPTRSFTWMLLHFPLAVLMYKVDMLATLHQMGTVLWALYVAFHARRPEKLIFAMAYITGSEVLWRSTGGRLPYESAKYLLTAISIIGVVRFTNLRVPWQPVLYFLLLLPSIIITVSEPLVVQAEEKTHFKVLMFNLAGPLALACCIAFLSQMRLRSAQLLNIFTGLLASTAGAAFLTVFAIRTAKKNSFWPHRC